MTQIRKHLRTELSMLDSASDSLKWDPMALVLQEKEHDVHMVNVDLYPFQAP